MNTSRMKYRRSLQVGGLIRLVLVGVIGAGVGGAFVVVKNRQHSLANAKAAMEAEIDQFHKQIDTLDLRIMAMVDRRVLAERLAGDMAGRGLIDIENAEQLSLAGQGGEQYASYKDTWRDENNY